MEVLINAFALMILIAVVGLAVGLTVHHAVAKRMEQINARAEHATRVCGEDERHAAHGDDSQRTTRG